jgi:hypothetical protein
MEEAISFVGFVQWLVTPISRTFDIVQVIVLFLVVTVLMSLFEVAERSFGDSRQ